MRKPYQAKTVAKFLIEAAEAAEPTICMTNSKLNSILYYVQAWYMIKYGTPCFTDQLYAYSWGVVVEDVHYTFRMFGNCSLWGIMANQIKTDEKLEQIFEYISDHEESNQKIFFDGQIYDAFSLLIGLIQKAEMEIVLVDGYVDVGTLNILSKKKENVAVTVYTLQRTKLSQTDVDNFNAQYPKLDVKYTRAFHDRFLILDKTKAYHVGASLKDAGKKCFGINLIEDAGIVRDILQRLELETEE